MAGRTARAAGVEGSADTVDEVVNEVRLRGRLSGDPEERELPSGDSVVVFRVVVDRPPGGRATHDTIDCAAYAAKLRRSVLRWSHGDVVEISGALHRRFFRAGGGPVSRYEVEAAAVQRLATAAQRERGTMTG
jgi:single-strand DNA-binding protein